MDLLNRQELTWEDFAKVDMRIGTITHAESFQEANKPAYILNVDCGELGLKKTSAQITDFYDPGDLLGKQVIAVVNFPPKQIATIQSECLVLGVLSTNGVTLIGPDQQVANGLKIG